MKRSKSIRCITILTIILYIISSFYFVFKTDEEVSMGLVQHNFANLLSISSLDVHPPFYYLALKVFLIVTTFWTKSIFVKVIFARIFSFICLLLFIYFLIKVLNNIDIYINNKYQIICFLIAPGVINESAKIRMYSLGAFLLIFELYQLIIFIKNRKILALILITISASLASYTFYPLAISAGLFILLFFVYELLNKHVKNSVLLFVSGICVILSYIPWVKIVFMQFKIHSRIDGSLVNNYFYTIIDSITQLNASSPASSLLKYMSVASLIVIFLFISLVMYSYIHSSELFNNILMITLINFILTLVISVIICKRQFRVTILYPIYVIFISLLITIFIKYFSSLKLYRIIKLLILLTGMIFIMYAAAAFVNNIKTYDIPSVQLVHVFHGWKRYKERDINIDKNASVRFVNHKIQGNATYATQDADYLKSLNKDAVIYEPTTKNTYNEFVSDSSNHIAYEFFHRLFPNLKFKE